MRGRLYAGIATVPPRAAVSGQLPPICCPRFNETLLRPGGLKVTGDDFLKETSMKKSAPASVAVAAALLLSGVSAASAASHMSKGAGGAMTAGDALALSATQQKEIWKDLGHHATNQTAPSGFNATVGAAIPSGISTYPLPRQAA